MFGMWSSPGNDLAPADLAPVDEIVTITMHGECVVIRPTSELDTMRTRVFADAVNAAVLADSVVMHATGEESDWPAPLGDSPPPTGDVGDPSGRVPVDVRTVCAGVICVPVCDVLWTIDITAGRFVRSDAPIDVRFLVDEDWTYYSAIWFTSRTITAATTAGSYVMGWRPHRDDDPCTPARRPVVSAIA